ncbi:MAG: Asp-tRNA(Asn)/Glu-tRNA(Gln) amidotransferase subunit GatB [Elusimicrobiota bacterium]
MSYEAVIGLEVHAQLNTESKIFCGCPTNFGQAVNTNICPVCVGYPGVLPVLNKKAVELLLKTALALNCRINPQSIFARKQYFYPDLPKNYQISQYEQPLAENGCLDIEVRGECKQEVSAAAGSKKKIRIHRIHLEEDAGKLMHALGAQELDYSLVDYNRTGIPLMEMVTEPDISSPEEAYEYLVALKSVLKYLNVSDCNMEEGSLRCDANISIRPVGEKKLGVKTEVKNMNSFKGVREALEYEIKRQKEVAQAGGRIVQETLLWDAGQKTTRSMRSKEEAHDYRYFPEPDLVPLAISAEWIEALAKTLPELPEARNQRFQQVYQLSEYDAEVLTADRSLADFYEQVLKLVGDDGESAKQVANWVSGELLRHLNAGQLEIKSSPISVQKLTDLVLLIKKGTLSGKLAKTVFEEMFTTGKSAQQIVDEKNIVQINDRDALNKIVDETIKENQKAVEEYRAGKDRALSALVGQIMKKTRGQANPGLVNELLKGKLKPF